MAPILSQYITGDVVNLIPSSSRSELKHRSLEEVLATDLSSTSVEYLATMFCFHDDHEIDYMLRYTI